MCSGIDAGQQGSVVHRTILWVVCWENATGSGRWTDVSGLHLWSCFFRQSRVSALIGTKRLASNEKPTPVILGELVRNCVPLKLTVCDTKETALELSCLLALPSFLSQGWWHEYQNFYCCGSDSPEGSSKKTIFGLIFLFPDPIPTLLPQAFFLKQPTRCALYCDHRAAVLATSMRRIETISSVPKLPVLPCPPGPRHLRKDSSGLPAGCPGPRGAGLHRGGREGAEHLLDGGEAGPEARRPVNCVLSDLLCHCTALWKLTRKPLFPLELAVSSFPGVLWPCLRLASCVPFCSVETARPLSKMPGEGTSRPLMVACPPSRG